MVDERMFHATVDVAHPANLPEPSPAVQELLGTGGRANRRAGAQAPGDPEAGELRAVQAENLTVFEALLRAFERAGFDDVVAVALDGKTVYEDVQETIGDFEAALKGVASRGAAAWGYAVLRTTFAHRATDLQILAELRCHSRRSRRPPRTAVRVVARPAAFDPRAGDGPREYAREVRGYVRDAQRLQSHREAVDGVVTALARSIPREVWETRVSVEPVRARFIAPGPRQLGRMRHLEFGVPRRRTVACSLPAYERVGPYDGPFSRHYYSPYQDLFHWLAVGEVLAGEVPFGWVEVVSATGRLLFDGETAGRFDTDRFAVSRDVVRVSPQGHLKIDASVPAVAGFDTFELGSPHSPGWAGEQWADDIEGG